MTNEKKISLNRFRRVTKGNKFSEYEYLYDY